MKSWDVRLLAGTYTRDEVIVELFGRTKEGESIAIRYKDFKPYFYVVEPPESVLSRFRNDSDVLNTEEKVLFVNGRQRKCFKITLSKPWLTPQYRERARPHCEILAADIPFVHRFIYDMNLGSCFRVFGEEMGKEGYTTNLVILAESFEEIEPFNPNLSILSFDIENSIKDNHIFTICTVLREDGKTEGMSFLGDEKRIIQDFIEYVQEKDPDVITGYNIDGYDLPILLERAVKNGIAEVKLARNLLPLRKRGERFWRIHGRIVADAWWSAKLELRPKQETLDHVARLVLGEGKKDVDPTKIDEEWQKDRDKVVQYCSKDAELALRIIERIAILEKSMDLATVARLPVDDALNGRTSTLIDSILIRVADREQVGVPMTKRGGGRKPIEGGYVHTMPSGLYHWVCVLDFKAMYPSLIISNNICFTTLSKDGEIVSPTGDRFLSKEQKEGILPRILKELMRERDEAKAKMRTAEGAEKEYYNRLQNAIKILMNAFYGVFASSFYRFTNPRIGATITAFARENTKNVINKLEGQGLKVIYGDTDSIFFQSPHDSLEGAVKIGKEIAERFSKKGATLEFEQVLEPFFSHGRKKRYVGRVVWPEEGMLVRGYEIRRTDAFDLQSEGQKMLFDRILGNDVEGAIKTAKDIVSDVREGRIRPEMLVISRTVKDESSYVNPEALPNVQAARKLKEMGYDFVPGMKVSWIVTNGRKTPQEVEPYVSGRKLEAVPDWDYYAHRLAHTLGYITEVFGWDKQSLLAGSQQLTLLSGDFGKGKSRKEGIRKTSKELKLEDFM